MSHTADFNLFYESAINFSVQRIIEIYVSNGWSIDKNGYAFLRPLGDKNAFNWVLLPLENREELYEIIRKKIEVGEDPAISMNYCEVEEVLITFHLKEKRINYLLMGRNKRLPDLPYITDINYYIVPIYKPLVDNGIGVTEFTFTETM